MKAGHCAHRPDVAVNNINIRSAFALNIALYIDSLGNLTLILTLTLIKTRCLVRDALDLG
jgi:hypothetical protein